MDPVEVDVERIDALFTFDLSARVAHARAAVAFRVPDGPPGLPALDLRQDIDSLTIDAATLDPEQFAHHDLGGGEGAEMRLLDADTEPGMRHELQLAYPLGLPDAEKAMAPQMDADRLHFDFWLSDLHPGRYLEQWLPVGLCGDRVALTLEVELAGTRTEHIVLANGIVSSERAGRWRIDYPGRYTSLSPLLVIAPSDEIETRTVEMEEEPELTVVCGRDRAVEVSLEEVEGSVRQWLAGNTGTYGPYCHGTRFTAYIWSSTRGMEYDGATTASIGSLEHEVFHSWFGRGIKPARASDGWIDEAWTSWCTSSRRYEGERFAVEPLGLDEEPCLLYPPHPWSRYTPVESYDHGARLFAGLADLCGGAEPLLRAMSEWYQEHAGDFVTTGGLSEQLSRVSGRDVGPWFDRYVYGHG